MTKATPLVFFAALLCAVIPTSYAMSQPYHCSNAPATYYVSAQGSDANSGTSISAAFLTIQKAIVASKPGNIIQVEPGTYYGNVSIWELFGTASSHYTLRGDPAFKRATIIIDGKIWITGSYWDLCHFRQTNNPVGPGIASANSTYILVNDVTIDHNYKSGFWMYGPGSNLVLANSTVRDNVLENYHGLQAASGKWDQAVTLFDVTSSTIFHNLIQNNWGQGVDIIARTVTIPMLNVVASNTVRDAWGNGLYNDNAPGNLWENNLIYADNAAYNLYGQPMQGMAVADEAGVGNGSVGVIFMNNITYNVACGFRYANYLRDLGLHSVEVIGNTIIGSTLDGIKIDNAASTSDNLISGNIFSSSTGSAAQIPNGSGLVFSHNIWSGALWGRPSGSGDIVAEPQLVGGPFNSSTSYRVKTTSPALAAAEPVTNWVTDFYGNVRTSSPTIGAIELPQ